ncbi:MAG: hypothetical protein H6945_01145 [Zoogloeaceae bacterium]|nr:hypothetical protein [Rhodocyclaceae bacterium]MCP5234331.1 hypothetical protein [Zoogloeaceae bacterium]
MKGDDDRDAGDACLLLQITGFVRARRRLARAAWTVLSVSAVDALMLVAGLGAGDVPLALAGLALLAPQPVLVHRARTALAAGRPVRRQVLTLAALMSSSLAVTALVLAPMPDHGVALAYLALLAIASAFAGWQGKRALAFVARARASLDDPTFPCRWLFDRPPRRRPLTVSRSAGRRWWLLAAVAVAALVVHIVLLEAGIVDVGVPAALYLLVAGFAMHRARRHAMPSAGQSRSADSRPPVLVLRAFRDDALNVEGGARWRGWLRPQPTLEEIAAHATVGVGPAIAIGDPSEQLPPLGAARDYLADADWRSVVMALVDEAAMVVLVLGDSDNLLWEFSMTMQRRRGRGVLVLLPPLRRRAALATRWRRFAAANAAVLGPGFPPELPSAPVTAFFFCRRQVVLVAGGRDSGWPYRLAIGLFVALRAAAPNEDDDLCRELAARLPTTAIVGGDG